MDPASLAVAAVAMLAPYASKLVESAVEKVGEEVPAAVGKVVGWMRDKLGGNPVEKASLEQLIVQQGSQSSQKMLELVLTERLRTEPALQDELFKLLPPEIQTTISQTAHVSGGSASAQTAGNNNQATIHIGKC